MHPRYSLARVQGHRGGYVPGAGTFTLPYVFRRNSPKQVADATPADAKPAEPSANGKGRPTPSRKDAEAARKMRLGALPADPKAAKKQGRETQRASYDRTPPGAAVG